MKEFELKFPFQRIGVYNFFDKNFYLMESFSPQTGNFLYCVMAAMNDEEVQGFSCQITVTSKDGKYKIDFPLPTLPIDEVFPLYTLGWRDQIILLRSFLPDEAVCRIYKD